MVDQISETNSSRLSIFTGQRELHHYRGLDIYLVGSFRTVRWNPSKQERRRHLVYTVVSHQRLCALAGTISQPRNHCQCSEIFWHTHGHQRVCFCFALLALALNHSRIVTILNTCLEKTALKRKYPQELHRWPVEALGSAQAPNTMVTNTVILIYISNKNCKPSFRGWKEPSAIISQRQQIQSWTITRIRGKSLCFCHWNACRAQA